MVNPDVLKINNRERIERHHAKINQIKKINNCLNEINDEKDNRQFENVREHLIQK